MLIIESKRAIFIHIEKCAGTAVEVSLDEFLDVTDLRIGGTRFGEQLQPLYRKRFGLHKHMKAREIRRILGVERYSRYFTFAFVREPVDRIISAYKYLRSGTWNSDIAARVTAMSSIAEFVRSDDFGWIAPCYEYVFDKSNHRIVDYVGKVETFDRDFSYVCGRLGVPQREIVRANVSREEVATDELRSSLLQDKEMVKSVTNRFVKDYEEFGYAWPGEP